MYKSSMNHYLLKQASGETIHFFHRKNEGVCVRTRKDNTVWSRITTIKSDVHDNFCATFNHMHKPCILCQSKHGDILLLQPDNQQWVSRTIQKSLSMSSYNKKPFMIRHEQGLMIFFRKINEGKSFLMCQTIRHQEIESSPVTIDEIDESGELYHVASGIDSLVVFYTQKKDNRLQPGYRVFHSDTGKWDVFSPVTGMKSPACIIEGYNDGKAIHTLWQSVKADKARFLYSRYDPIQDTWLAPKILLEPTDPVQGCSILSCQENLIFYWIIHNTIYFRLSIDQGETWSNLETYLFGEGEDYYKVRYLESNPAGRGNTCTIPGIFNGGYRLAFTKSGGPGGDSKLHLLSNRLIETTEIPQQISSLKQDLTDLETKYNTLMEKFQQVDRALKTQISKSTELEKALTEGNRSPAKTKTEDGLAFTLFNPCNDDPFDIPKDEKPLMPGAGFSNITIRYLEENNGSLSQ